MDYVSKWVEAIAYPKNDANIVVGFIQRNSLSRFGTPRTVISDVGSHVANKVFAKTHEYIWNQTCNGIGLSPSVKWEAEISNREIKKILEKTVNTSRNNRSIKLDDALWAYRNAYKNPIGISPYKIVFGKPCHLPLKLKYKAMWAIKKLNFVFKLPKNKDYSK